MEDGRLRALAEEAMHDFTNTDGFPSGLKGKMEKLMKQVLPPHTYAYTSLLVPKAYQILKPDANEEDLKLACKLGWCYEMYQTYGYIIDDSFSGDVDHQTRNDLQMLEALRNKLMRKHFFKLGPVYFQLVNIFLECGYESCKAHQVEAIRTVKNLKKGIIPLESFTMETYRTVANMKGAPTHFYLPIALALTLAGENISEKKDLFEKVKSVNLRLGILFQCMVDYYDSFSKESDTSGETKDSDIRDGQFSWVFLTAKDHCPSEEDWELLKENYGQNDDAKVEVVKNLYDKLNIPDLFGKFKVNEYKGISAEIGNEFEGFDEKVGKVMKWCLGHVLKVFSL